MSKETHQQLTEENFYQNFRLAVEQEDQVIAQEIISGAREREYFDLADTLEKELKEYGWYCGECEGHGTVMIGEHDNVEEKPCVCQK